MKRASLLQFACFTAIVLLLSPDQTEGQAGCTCNGVNNNKGAGCLNAKALGNQVCKNNFGNWGVCIPASGCPKGNFGGPARKDGNFTEVAFMQPIPTWSYIYECQNATLFMAVYNMSLKGWNEKVQPLNLWVNTVTCVTTVPAGAAAGIFDVNTYNSCDNAGSCGACGGCNCTCRVDNPWWWQCCYDPCFGCSTCCGCQTSNWNWNWYDTGSCLQCNHDGWCGEPNGQMLTPTVCQFALAAISPSNRLDFESLASTNFTYQVRIFQRTVGCQACNAEAIANLTVYVKDCNEWPIFDRSVTGTTIYQYDGLSGVFNGPAFNIPVHDPDIYNTAFNTVQLNVERVTLTNVGSVRTSAFYITNSKFIGDNNNISVLYYDASGCGANTQQCLDMFRYSYSGAVTPVFTVWVIAVDGGGAISTWSYTITVLDTPLVPQWVNLPATVSILEKTAGPGQIYPMEGIVPGYLAAKNVVNFILVNTDPLIGTGGPYLTTGACTPAVSTALQCNGLLLTANVVSGASPTFLWSRQQTYNVTVWLTNTVTGSITTYTITSSIIIKILQIVYQPTLIPSTDTYWLKENVTGTTCFYNITGIYSPNNHTFFVITMSNTPIHNAIYMNGTAICYDGGRQTLGSGTTTGWIFNARSVPIYTIRVGVNDPLSTQAVPTFTLTLSINDVEDPPLLTVPVYQNIPETATAWTVLVNVTKETNQPAVKFILTDQSSANNNTMWYISSQASTYAGAVGTATIMANPNIVTSPMFNFSRTPVIYLNVVAYTAQYTVTGRIIFFIQRVNSPCVMNNLPNRTSIAEAITLYVPFFTISTSDRENDYRRVFIQNPTTLALSNYDPSGKFYLDPDIKVVTTYIPTAATGFNFYATPIYTLTICCVDSPPVFYSPLTSTTTLVVFIVLNQTAPTWVTPPPGANQVGSTVSPNIKENVTGQKYIFTLTATDREGDRVYYNITDVRPNWNKAFRIPWTSNLLEYNQDYATSSPMFNFKIYPVYYIVVEASDQKTSPTSTTTLTVSIDYNDLPVKWTSLPAYVSVREDVYWGPTDLVTVSAIDPNNKYPVTITYLYTSPSSGSTKLYYNTSTYTVGYNFDPHFAYGVVSSYVMYFTAFNTIQPSATSSVVVQILKVPTGPDLNTTGTVYIHENVTAGQTLWDMRARDNNSNTLQYGIFDVNPSGFTKFVVTANGLIRSVDKPGFNYQQAPVYVVRATVRNVVGLQNTFTLTVSIIDDPQMPIITNLPSFASIVEGTKNSVLGGLFSTKCVDQDSRKLYYNYNVLPNTGYSYFNITSDGVVQITQYSAFSYLDQPYYYVQVFCHNGAYTATGTLSVVVIWTTSTTSTTPKPRTTVPDDITTTTVVPAGDLLTPEQIGAIVGSLLGALCLAGAAWGIARYLQQKARTEGLTRNMKKPYQPFSSYKI